MKPTTIHISKLLSLVLRHKPETIGLQLDDQGWADTNELLERLKAHGTPVDREGLTEVVTTNDKQRFSFNEEGSKIRANQGHSLSIDLGLVAQQPPVILYHGTAQSSVADILAHGLKKQNRHHVHLSQDVATARTVGSRHGMTVVLRVDAEAMVRAGLLFYRSANGVWLTDYVAPNYLQLMD